MKELLLLGNKTKVATQDTAESTLGQALEWVRGSQAQYGSPPDAIHLALVPIAASLIQVSRHLPAGATGNEGSGRPALDSPRPPLQAPRRFSGWSPRQSTVLTKSMGTSSKNLPSGKRRSTCVSRPRNLCERRTTPQGGRVNASCKRRISHIDIAISMLQACKAVCPSSHENRLHILMMYGA
jgi:hypothetical protein